MQHRIERIIANSSLDAPHIVDKLDWKIILKLIAHDSELIIFKSINGLAPQYMIDLFIKLCPHT